MRSRRKRVALVGSEDDVHTLYVADAVRRAGARTVVLDTGRPMRVSAGGLDEPVRWGPDTVDELDALYIKSLRLSVPTPRVSDLIRSPHHDRWPDRYRATRERHALLRSTLAVLEERAPVVVNPLHTYALHLEKHAQAARLSARGFPTPAALATDDPVAARAFLEAHVEVIAKPLSGGALARLLREEDLPLLPACPALLQERVHGRELRAYVLDGEPLAAFEIPTAGAVDARENLERVRPGHLDERTWQLCLDAAAALDLVFTAVDLRLTARGPVLLELNPAAAIAFHDDPVDGRVIRALAAHLARGGG